MWFLFKVNEFVTPITKLSTNSFFGNKFLILSSELSLKFEIFFSKNSEFWIKNYIFLVELLKEFLILLLIETEYIKFINIKITVDIVPRK